MLMSIYKTQGHVGCKALGRALPTPGRTITHPDEGSRGSALAGAGCPSPPLLVPTDAGGYSVPRTHLGTWGMS